MAEGKGLFINTVVKALIEAENHLLVEELEKDNVKKALKELKVLLEPVARGHFGEVRSRHKYAVGQYFPILQPMATQWYKQFMRRMTARCRVRSPWKVILDVSVPNELFAIIKDMVLVTNFGLYYSETKSKPKKCVLTFTSQARVRNLFLQLMNSDMSKEDFLQKKFKGHSRIEVIVNEDKQFGMLYNYEKEVIFIDFHYGFWNEQGFPQHL